MRSNTEFSELDGHCNHSVVKGGHDFTYVHIIYIIIKTLLSSNWALIFIFNIKWLEFKYPYSLEFYSCRMGK